MCEDSNLLRRYVSEGSNEAFGRLVERHCNLVWCAAYRILRDQELARDVAQTTFAALARKAGRIPPEVVLAGWLYQAARRSAAMMARTSSRRARREEQAMQLQKISQRDPEETRAVEELQPLLDAALGQLDELDRNAIVLRFLCGRSLAEVGAALGGSEDAARMRVARALDKLRDSFRRRGVDLTSGVLSAGLGLAGSQAAPAGAAGILAVTASAGAGSISASSLFSFMNSKLALALAVGLPAVGGLTWQYRALTQLRAANEALELRISSARALPATPAADNSREEELTRLRAEHDELLRLRGEYALLLHRPAASPDVGRLKADLAAARDDAARDRAVVDKIKWKEQSDANRALLASWGSALQMVAKTQKTRRLPNDFSQVLPYFDRGNQKPWNQELGARLVASQGLFEFVDQGRAVAADESNLIVMRERVPTQSPDGEWARAYLMADGAGVVQVSPDGDFSAWEQSHLAVPGSVTPPDPPPPVASGN